MRVSALKDGTVIDHIPPAVVFKIARVLEAHGSNYEILIGNNLQSKRIGRKGVIKLSKVFLDKAGLDKIGLLAPGATIATIKNYLVDSKKTAGIPSKVKDIVCCFNPNCITNHESAVTKFSVIDKKTLRLQCHYCEKIMEAHQIRFR